MSKKFNNKPTKKESGTLISHEEQLERENELLRLEVAYFKKVKSFTGEPERIPRKAAVAFELKQEGFKLKDVLIIIGIPEVTYHAKIGLEMP